MKSYILFFLCLQDYVTEKFFNILAYNVIPVVFNGANMSAIAPPHSYINAEDFSSVEQLAEYLQVVASNDSLFASYFWWRDYYRPLTVGGCWRGGEGTYFTVLTVPGCLLPLPCLVSALPIFTPRGRFSPSETFRPDEE